MPDLLTSLQKHDLGHLHIIAGFWGLELESRDADSAAEELCAAILDADAVRETLDILPPDARAALTLLIQSNGKMEWALLSRKHGEIREMGEARRDRERPHLKPISAAEILFYRGLLEKAFFDTDKGAQEFGYIPDDMFEMISEDIKEEIDSNKAGKPVEPLGRLATPIEKTFEIPATDHILDDATTYLAALRAGRSRLQRDMQELLSSANILKKNEPQAEAVKKFLEASREDALIMLHAAWYESQIFDELRLIPTIICEGEWKNQPQVTREFLMNLVNDLPQNKWWSLPAFLRDLKIKFPDFQRPAGDYDSWFIKRASDGQYLRGFAYWDQVDGALVKYFIQMLHWLGKVDLAAPEEGKEFTAFRMTAKDEGGRVKDEGRISISSNGKIIITRNFSRAVRYQISRFCEWDDEKNNEYTYHVTAKSLKQASQQGLKAEQLLALLVKYTKGSVPPALVKALKQWDAHGVEARVMTQTVLRVSRPEIVEELRKSKAGKFLGEALSPTAVIIKSGAESNVLNALTELGLLADIET